MSTTTMQGKVVLVTGGARGVGAATATLLAERGAAVGVNYLSAVGVNYLSNEVAAERVVQEIRAAGGQATALQGDVRDAGDVDRIVRSVHDTYGRIDGLVGNASMRFVRKPVLEISWDELAQKVNDELKAAYELTRTVGPMMVAQGGGRIVYVGSNIDQSPTLPGGVAHGAAKAGLVMFCRYVAAELGASGITANVVSLGIIDTEATADLDEMRGMLTARTPLKRIGQPLDAARAIAFYLSDDSGFITGTRATVNGGLEMH